MDQNVKEIMKIYTWKRYYIYTEDWQINNIEIWKNDKIKNIEISTVQLYFPPIFQRGAAISSGRKL